MKAEVYRVKCDLCGKVAENDEVDGYLSVQTMFGPSSSRKLAMEARGGKAPGPVPSGEFCSLAHLAAFATLPLSEVMRIVEETNAKEHEGHGHPDIESIITDSRMDQGYA
jgi:hypothetical protein